MQLILLFIFACNNSISAKRDIAKLHNEKEANESLIDTLSPGRYQNISLGVKGSQIAGVYEYYNGWDDKVKEYAQINVFYFVGELNNSVALIKTGWPTSDQQISGTVKVIHSNNDVSLNLSLEEMPEGYADTDFTIPEGITQSRTFKKYWEEVRIIKENKTKLFERPDSAFIRKGYLIANDIVKVISKMAMGGAILSIIHVTILQIQ